jgi:alkyldihydroxyacetonephosphate synthase
VPGLLREWLGVTGAVVTPPAAELRLPAPREAGALRERLAGIAGAEHVRDDDAIRALRAAGKSYLDLLALRAGAVDEAPDLVVAPGGHDEVQAVLEACAEADAAVIPFGGGTSVVGGVAPVRGEHALAVCLDLARLDGLLALDPVDRVARVAAGTRLPELEHALGAHGLRLGHLPQSFEWATAGGCAATRSAGQASTGVGRFEELVAALRCATPAGELATPAVPASAAGPELRELVLGSEGTLGVITELALRVRPLPAAARYEGWLLRSFEAGCDVLRALAQDELAPDVARLSDADETRTALALSGSDGAVRRAGDAAIGALGYRPGCLLIAGWEGEEAAIGRRRGEAARRLRKSGGLPLGRSAGEAWRATRFTGPHLRDDLLDRGVLVETLETAASWSRLGAVHAAVRAALHGALAATPPQVGCHVSHLYPDGASLYFTVLARQDADPAAQWLAAKAAASDAIAAGGATITHHHAVGRDHARWAAAERGALGTELLRAAKRACDPAGIMNPGKLLPG